jgi:hypothetical protein
MPLVDIPDDNYINDLTDPAPAAEGVAGATGWFEQLRDFVSQLPGALFEASVTLASDTFTPTQSAQIVTPESGAADNLATIGVGIDGMVIRIRPAASKTITVKNATGGVGQILLADGADFVMSDPSMQIWASYDATSGNWREEQRSYGNNKSALRTWLALVVGTNVQAYSAALTTLAGAITSAGQAMAAAANAAAQRTLLGLGTAATKNTGTSAGNVVEVLSGGKLPALDGSDLTGVGGGVVIARGYAEYTASANLATTMNGDDTPPLITEGTEVLSVTIATTTVTQRVRLIFKAFGGHSVVDGWIIAALFQGSTCIDAVAVQAYSQNRPLPLGMAVEVAPGAAASYTFSVRAGTESGNCRLNGTNLGRLFGGTARATLIAEVIEP